MYLRPTALTAMATVLAWPLAASAHPGEHSGMALRQAASHFASSPVHLPALLFAGAVFAGALWWGVARISARSGERTRR